MNFRVFDLLRSRAFPGGGAHSIGPIGCVLTAILFIGILVVAIVPHRGDRAQSRIKSCYANARVLLGGWEMLFMDLASGSITLEPGEKAENFSPVVLTRLGYFRGPPRCPDQGLYSGYAENQEPKRVSCAIHGHLEQFEGDEWYKPCQELLEKIEVRLKWDGEIISKDPFGEFKRRWNGGVGEIPSCPDRKIPSQYGFLQNFRGKTPFCSSHGVLKRKVAARSYDWKNNLEGIFIFGIIFFTLVSLRKGW